MKTSESITKIFPALIAAQAQYPDIIKGAENPYFKSKYADLAAILSAIRKPMATNGLALIQFPGAIADGKLTITTRIIHASGEWIEEDAQIPLQKNDPQGFGSTVSYGKRYCISAALGLICEAEDDDGNAAMPTTPAPQPLAKKPAEKPAEKMPAVDIKGEVLAAKYNAEKSRSEYEIETPEHDHFTVFIKSPLEVFETRQPVDIIGYWISDFKGKTYHMAKAIKSVVADEEIPF